MENTRDLDTLEKKASRYILNKLREASPALDIKCDSSDRSHSQYIYAWNSSKGVGIKISDHLKEMNLKYIKFITRRRENREFYLFTVKGYSGFKEFYNLDRIDELVSVVL